MKKSIIAIVVASCATWSAGCVEVPVDLPPDPLSGGVSAETRADPVAWHRHARLAFDQRRYDDCIASFKGWLARHEADCPELAASARFFIALSYRYAGDRVSARAAFQDICRRYASAAESSYAAKWRHWAHEELDRLGN